MDRLSATQTNIIIEKSIILRTHWIIISIMHDSSRAYRTVCLYCPRHDLSLITLTVTRPLNCAAACEIVNRRSSLAAYAITEAIADLIETLPLVNIAYQLHERNSRQPICLPWAVQNKSSAVAEMGDSGHNRHGPKGGGVLCPFRGALGTHLIQCGLRGGLYLASSSTAAVWPQ